MKRKHVLTLTAMLACSAAGAWFGHGLFHRDVDAAMFEPAAESGETSDGVSTAKADEPAANDRTAESLLAQSNRGEALSWLNDTSTPRGVARWDKSEALDLIRDFYKAGAKMVYVVDTDRVAQTEVASQLILELPRDAAARKAVFAREAQFQAQYDEDPTPDSGQKYLQITTE
jgi:hypothetical protein